MHNQVLTFYSSKNMSEVKVSKIGRLFFYELNLFYNLFQDQRESFNPNLCNFDGNQHSDRYVRVIQKIWGEGVK